jgi:LysR family glycine cleavage system transcriptional activator
MGERVAKSRSTSIRHLQVFCAAARALSFKRAAEHLYLTPSAVSHRIRELETGLDVSLFERHTRSLELSASGRALFEEAAPLLDALEHTLVRLSQRHARRQLRLTIPQFFASELFMRRVTGFYARWPGIEIRLDSQQPRPRQHAADADASILLATRRPEGVRATPLFDLSLAAVGSPARRASLGSAPEALPTDTVLLVHASWPDAWQKWAAARQVALPVSASVIEVDTMFSLVRAAERGMGLALVPARLCDAWLLSGQLVRFCAEDLATDETYWFATREADADRPEVRALRDWVLMEFASS